MALIHEQLYQSHDLAKIEFSEYVKTLTTNLLSSYEIYLDAVAIKIDIDNIFLSVDAAIPCGLIINELVSNSLKHAFLPGQEGEICIGLHVAATPAVPSGEHCGDFVDNNNRLILSISDDGIGFPEDLDFKNTESLGLQIVTALTNQLEGTIELNRNNGTEFEIKF
jgi:two-component sensor histidine kinase